MLNNWMMASAQAAHARAVMHLSESRLDEAIRDARLNFEHSPEYRDAVQAAQKAYDAYTAERQKALRSVVNDPKYQANIELRDQLAESLARIRGSARPNQIPQEELLAIASQKLQYASAAHSMERNATEGDASLQDARRRMVEAQARVTDLRAQFDASIRNNAQVQQARRTLEDSRVMLITAEAYLNASATAGAIATDYAYYRHRWEGLAGPAFTDGWGTPAYGY